MDRPPCYVIITASHERADDWCRENGVRVTDEQVVVLRRGADLDKLWGIELTNEDPVISLRPHPTGVDSVKIWDAVRARTRAGEGVRRA